MFRKYFEKIVDVKLRWRWLFWDKFASKAGLLRTSRLLVLQFVNNNCAWMETIINDYVSTGTPPLTRFSYSAVFNLTRFFQTSKSALFFYLSRGFLLLQRGSPLTRFFPGPTNRIKGGMPVHRSNSRIHMVWIWRVIYD